MRGYDSNLIFNGLDKFDVKISVIPNGLEQYMTVLIDSMQFMNSILDELVKNLSDENFKYLVKEFRSESLEILKQKDAYAYEYTNSFERFNKEKLPAKKDFYSSIKDEKISDDGKILDGHISVKDYLTSENFGMSLE